MFYATQADIVGIYGERFLSGLFPDDIDPALATATALRQAGGEIDLYLSKRYTLPLAAVPEGIRTAAIDIACYRLAVTHDRLTDEIKDRAKSARKLIEDVAAGRADLPPADSGSGSEEPATPAENDFAAFFSRPKQWGGSGGLL